MSRTWAEELCDAAVDRDPGPNYPTAEGISAAVFDNLMMNVGYSSFATGGQAGIKIEMTNWATLFLPAAAMPTAYVGMDALLGAGGIFRTDVSMETFINAFSPHALDIVRNQRARWASFLDKAAAGSIWDTEPYNSPYPPTKFFYHPPIFDRLQSSYEDVNFELDVMRSSIFHRYSDALMLGGDGLSYMRLIHRLSQDPRQYLETKPVVMPRMGENPHGLYHFMHGDWRIWAPLLMRLAAVVNNKQVKCDPTIVDFNTHQHFLRVVIQALSEYVVEIAQTGSDYHAAQHFLNAAEQNLSFAYTWSSFCTCLGSNIWTIGRPFAGTNRSTLTFSGERTFPACVQQRATRQTTGRWLLFSSTGELALSNRCSNSTTTRAPFAGSTHT